MAVALAQLMEVACTGGLDEGAAETLCSATLIPLNKKDGGVRPIAVGETVRRLVGKTLLRTPQVAKDAEKLAPRQVGVGIQRAPELVGMTLQEFIAALPTRGDWLCLQVDVRNGYNTLAREAVLTGTKDKWGPITGWRSAIRSTRRCTVRAVVCV